MESESCRQEVALAAASKKRIVPLLFRGATWPVVGPMALLFTKLLSVNCRGCLTRGKLREIVAAIKKDKNGMYTKRINLFFFFCRSLPKSKLLRPLLNGGCVRNIEVSIVSYLLSTVNDQLRAAALNLIFQSKIRHLFISGAKITQFNKVLQNDEQHILLLTTLYQYPVEVRRYIRLIDHLR